MGRQSEDYAREINCSKQSQTNDFMKNVYYKMGRGELDFKSGRKRAAFF